ncbi:terminase family protein [Alteriqipengyuania flavescens]|uniref:terminase large subunit domain-containing protein n=1 Tax=Alteriqipengyuania flavescens TaxID=3053610 RepID=UPI0025B36119|nr:terminase family protein [Alteriqipengyuania flavescens]WJY18710.1 terminase family protein [Alteriqipengyuania flavescens]WJY24650.1 terminase family protein [Alteriqipengyuania flavescens]
MSSGAPAVLLPYQREAILLSDQHDLLVIEKSRRTGITYGFAADAVLTAAERGRGGQNVFYIAYNLDMTREFIDYCGSFTKAFDKAASAPSEFLYDDGSEEGIKAFRIDFPSGYSVVALSSKPRSLRGKQGKVIIDEAAFHDQLAELLKAALALLMWGGKVVLISTHDGADNPFNELIEEIRAGKRSGYVQRVTLRRALEEGLYRRICLVTGKEWTAEAEREWEADLRRKYGAAAEEELDVVPARGSGVYIARATIQAAMSADLPVIRLTCPDGFEREHEAYRTDWVREFLEEEVAPWLADFDRRRHSFFGQDFARSGDVSPAVFGQYDDLGRLIARVTLEMRNVPFREQEFALNWILKRLPLFAAGKVDARGNGSALAEALQQDWGFDRIEAVQTSEKTYLAFMPKLRASIEDRTMLIPLDDGTMDDLRMVKLVRGVPKIPDRSVVSKADGAKGQRHGDNAIALMHFRAAADEDFAPFDFRSAGGRSIVGRASAGASSERGFGTVGSRATMRGY